jgi:uncharacterized membrane protein YeaQ/YmgE (transglycosylase-associated protein family)
VQTSCRNFKSTALVGGFLFSKLDIHVVPDFWGNLITATSGAIVLLFVWQAIRRA